MFICKTCLEKNYFNFGMFTSFGVCEECNLHSMCHDIPTANLSPRPVVITLEDLGIQKTGRGAKIVGLEKYLQKQQDASENELLSKIAMQSVKPPVIPAKISQSFDIISLHNKHIKTKPMISNEDYSTEKSPWRWLWHGDKAWLVPAFFLFTCIATWVSWEYEWVVPALTLLIFGSITLGLVIYRVKDYKSMVGRMEILSVFPWAKFKQSH